MSQNNMPTWYHPGDIVESVKAASCNSNTPTQEIVTVLGEHEFDAPDGRIRNIVETARERISNSDANPQMENQVDEDLRPLESRFVDATDVSYLSTRDFALVLGAVLSRYEGSFRTPEDVDEMAVDLFWNRQYTTVAFRTISKPAETPVEEADIRAVASGNTNPRTGRSPSVLGIVSNSDFMPNARELAEKHDIKLFGETHLQQWFTDAKLTYEALGVLLDDGEKSIDGIKAILADLPPIPDVVKNRDPLGKVLPNNWAGSEDDNHVRPTMKLQMPIAEKPPKPGKQGELYADPREDGDFGAFDRFTMKLQEDDDE